ncbi:MAG: DUF3899 domain-containing protein [Clostridiales bacterium]|nr:DUF3899 domain-containing protein [Clostridiales bacterium]
MTGRDKAIEYSVVGGVGLVTTLIVAFIRRLFWLTESTDILRTLCDCFSVPGLILILIGAIIVCSNGGAFYAFGFAGKKFISLFQSDEKRKANKESYYDYRQRKQEKQRSFGSFFIIGGVFLLIGIAFLIAYYNV